MSNLTYVPHRTISLQAHPELNEKWVQARIADNPSILGLGDLILKDQERRQPKSGRLDLLLQDADRNTRYEVELQLGSTDESHVIRTIEYWDLERKRYPQYDHTAVIIAEDITSRFLNVISLFNGFIPLVAIQMQAIAVGDHLALVFVKVLDQMPLGPAEDDEQVQEVDRSYWEKRGAPKTVAMADHFLSILHGFDAALSLNYNKHYIGLVNNDIPNNFVVFKPKKAALRVEVRLPRSDDISDLLEQSGLELMEYDGRSGYYRIRLEPGDEKKHTDVIADLLRQAYERASG